MLGLALPLLPPKRSPLLSPASVKLRWPGLGPRSGCDNQNVYSARPPAKVVNVLTPHQQYNLMAPASAPGLASHNCWHAAHPLLSVIIYVLVSGSLLFDGHTAPDLRSRIVSCQYRIPFYLSRDCELLIRGLLVAEPARRLGLAAIARHRWLVGQLDTARHQRLLEDMAAAAEPGAEAATAISEAAVERAARLAD